MESLLDFIRTLPKAELHVHIEGTLEPELMFELAGRNGVSLPYLDVEAVEAAYEFTDLQSFLDIYYQAAGVLQTEEDFYRLMLAYLDRAAADGVLRAEMFFDPQTHTERGIGFETFMSGFFRAIREGERKWGISSGLILCFLRHLPLENALATFESARPYLADLLGVGLDSSEQGFPPEDFVEVYRQAKEAGLRCVAHAGEEGPPSYVWAALDVLGVERIDHGVRAFEDDSLIERLGREGIPLTMCPLSNRRLQVTPDLSMHPLRSLWEKGVKVTINSDDPSYFGGYVADNYLAIAEALGLSRHDLVRLAQNSIEASFGTSEEKARWAAGLPSVEVQG